jgi:hypothetical protein
MLLIPPDRLNAKQWAGHPITMIRRAIIALGTLRVNKWPEKFRSDLLRLQELYARPAPEVKHRENPAEDIE